MDQSIFYHLSLVLALAAGITLMARLFRQPPIIGYIAAGFLIGPAVFNVAHADQTFESFSQIGIALLLFMVGLGLNVAIIKNLGKPVLFTFVLGSLLVGGAAYGASWLLNFSTTECWLIATALIFSSTIIVVKTLSDKRGQGRLYGQLAIGVLLVEDLIASLALVWVSTQGGSATSSDLWVLLAKAAGLGLALAVLGGVLVPRLIRQFATSQELLFIFSLAWAFGVASTFWWMGFSLEVGALFAGVALAHVPYAQEMGTRLKPLRDFFIILFFIGLGVQLGPNQLGGALGPALVFSAVVLLLKPLVVVMGLGLLGYTKQTSFKAAVHLSQISEFSIILIVLAVGMHLAGERLVAIMTLTALITIGLSSYLMKYDEQLYRRLKVPLSFFERAETKRELRALQHYPLVLLGYHKGGYEFVKTFRQMKKPFVVIDFDPDVIDDLEHRRINHIYGDVTDLELLEEIGVHRSELVISTIGDAATNKLILDHVARRNKRALFICHANSYDEAEEFYSKGAAYVILPHFIGSEQISAFIRRHGSNKAAFEAYRRDHLVSIGRIAAAS